MNQRYSNQNNANQKYSNQNVYKPVQNNNSSPSSNHDNISNDNFKNNPKLQGIDPLKLKIIMEIKEQSKHKSMEELLPQIMQINQELNRRNMNFSKSETALLMEAIEESLSPAEKQKFNMIKGFIK